MGHPTPLDPMVHPTPSRRWVPILKERTPEAREQTNIVVVPMDAAQRLCELADEINASSGVAPQAGYPSGCGLENRNGGWQMEDDSDGSSGWKRAEASDLCARGSK